MGAHPDDWTALIEAVRAARPSVPVVLYPADGDEALASRAVRAGVDDYVPAGMGESDLAGRLVAALERRRNRQRRERERSRYRRYVDADRESVVVVEPGGRFGDQGPSFERVTGYAPADLRGDSVYDYLHPDDRDRYRQALYDVILDPETAPRIEYRFCHRDGRWLRLESRLRNLIDDEAVGGVVCYTRDVSERRTRERELAAYREVIDQLGDPVYRLDRNGTIVLVNDAFVARTGYPREVVVGSKVTTLLSDADHERGAELVRELVSDAGGWDRYTFVLERADGGVAEYETTISVVTDEDDGFLSAVGVLHGPPELL
ncbi:hypothetical protein BRC83_07735 [Halobacteriales archaeon QS_1_68_17]|nr:MAG: hypothetical protein BRC83_07735 [Halobacteriales archaeon QS_1_68_17]